MDIRDYLAAWRARWVVVVACTVLAVGAAALVSAFTQPTYVATARLFVSTTGGASVSEAYQGNLFSTERVRSYAGLAAGKQVAQRSVDELGLTDSAESVMSKIETAVVPDSVLLDITVTDAVPALARDLANVVASQTSQLVQELETSARGGTPAAAATIVDLADLPTDPSAPQWWRNIGFGVAGGLIVGLVAAVAREKLDGKIRSATALAQACGVPLLGSVPREKNSAGKQLFGPSRPGATEALRGVRAAILALDTDTSMRTVIVTAPERGAGTSTIAAGIAVAIAETERSVVLVEADFARTTPGMFPDLVDVAGLSEFLRAEAGLYEVVTPTEIDRVSVVTAGKSPDSVSTGLYGSATMTDFLYQLRQHFDHVVIDAPALNEVTDTAVLAAASNGVVMVGRRGSTTTDGVEAAEAKLSLAAARLVGCVANGRTGRWVGW